MVMDYIKHHTERYGPIKQTQQMVFVSEETFRKIIKEELETFFERMGVHMMMGLEPERIEMREFMDMWE